jgi:hypothetical protein
MAVEISDLVGTWDMVHDDWEGKLTINPTDQQLQEVDGACTFTYWVVSGTWMSTDGIARPVNGTFQGHDIMHRTEDKCPSSSHLVQLAMEFGNGEPVQIFEGYVFTHKKRRMAGYTLWHGLPFGWYAIKV